MEALIMNFVTAVAVPFLIKFVKYGAANIGGKLPPWLMQGLAVLIGVITGNISDLMSELEGGMAGAAGIALRQAYKTNFSRKVTKAKA